MTTELDPSAVPSTTDRHRRRPVRIAYLVLAVAVVVEIVIQAAAMVWAVAGLGLWVSQGGLLDSSVMESEATPFPEVAGFLVHGINGSFIVPAIALALLVVSFFTRARARSGGR